MIYENLKWFSDNTGKSLDSILKQFEKAGLTGKNTPKGKLYETIKGLETIYKPANSQDITTSKKENIDVDTRLKQMKELELLGKLAPIEALEYCLTDVCAQMAAILETLPVKLKRANPQLNSNDMLLITREVVKCRNAMSEVRLNLE